MIDKWFQNDINKVLAVHDRMVVTDALGEGGFLLDYLPSDVVVINTGNEEIDEIKARYRAEKDCIGKKVVFYKQNTPDSLCFLLEYAETYGCIVLDDMEAYIRKHLFEGIKENTELGKHCSHTHCQSRLRHFVNIIIKEARVSDNCIRSQRFLTGT